MFCMSVEMSGKTKSRKYDAKGEGRSRRIAATVGTVLKAKRIRKTIDLIAGKSTEVSEPSIRFIDR
jgi:hypothetical protein